MTRPTTEKKSWSDWVPSFLKSVPAAGIKTAATVAAPILFIAAIDPSKLEEKSLSVAMSAALGLSLPLLWANTLKRGDEDTRFNFILNKERAIAFSSSFLMLMAVVLMGTGAVEQVNQSDAAKVALGAVTGFLVHTVMGCIYHMLRLCHLVNDGSHFKTELSISGSGLLG